jgi:hypothetical protein
MTNIADVWPLLRLFFACFRWLLSPEKGQVHRATSDAVTRGAILGIQIAYTIPLLHLLQDLCCIVYLIVL